MGKVVVNPHSLQNAAAILHDLAHDLQAGQFDLFLLDWADRPASPRSVSRSMRKFGEAAHDQYQDMVALLAALSTRVKNAAAKYQQTDEHAAQDLKKFLTESTYRPAPGSK